MIVVDTVAEAIAGKYIDDLWSKITNKKYGEATEYVRASVSLCFVSI